MLYYQLDSKFTVDLTQKGFIGYRLNICKCNCLSLETSFSSVCIIIPLQTRNTFLNFNISHHIQTGITAANFPKSYLKIQNIMILGYKLEQRNQQNVLFYCTETHKNRRKQSKVIQYIKPPAIGYHCKPYLGVHILDPEVCRSLEIVFDSGSVDTGMMVSAIDKESLRTHTWCCLGEAHMSNLFQQSENL